MKRVRQGRRSGRIIRSIKRYSVQRALRAVGFAVLLATTAFAMLTVIGCPQPTNAPPVSYAARSSRELVSHFEQVPLIRALIASGGSLRVCCSGSYRTLADGRVVAEGSQPMPEVELTRTADGWDLGGNVYPGSTLVIEPQQRSLLKVGQGWYRGKIAFMRGDDGDILAVNCLDVESYLAGVISKELYPNWNDVTYQAQCIAARTYALYEKAVAGPEHPYDVRSDQGSQVYGGLLSETDKSWRAVQATHAQVLATGSAGRETIFKAYFSACCGGLSNSAYVLSGDPVRSGPLAGGRVCEDCVACPKYRWPAVSVPKSVVYRALVGSYPQARDLGRLSSIEVVDPASGDRPVWVEAVGQGGQRVRVRADDLRLALLRDGDGRAKGLYSMNCRIRNIGDNVVFDQGKGFGHGVGLCQWGAQGKAEAGYSVHQILACYYPGAQIITEFP